MKYLVFTLLFSSIVWSQDFDTHKWKNRIILITADENHHKFSETQLNLFINEKEKLIERKIVIYQCITNKCIYYNWKQSPQSVEMDILIDGFKTVLIGLDGGVKYKTFEVENTSIFFDLIDSMPMRLQELEKNKKND